MGLVVRWWLVVWCMGHEALRGGRGEGRRLVLQEGTVHGWVGLVWPKKCNQPHVDHFIERGEKNRMAAVRRAET
jgi:hypothetical protein